MSRRRRRRARRRKILRKIVNAGSKALKAKTGVDLGRVGKKRKAAKPVRNSPPAATPVNQPKPTPPGVQSAMDRVQVSNSTGTYQGGNVQKVKDWFLIKYHTAKGAFIGCVVGATIVSVQLLGIYDFFQLFTSKKRRIRRRR
jgi:hypothetical protein